MQGNREQPQKPDSSPLHRFDVALSRVKIWKLIPVLLVPIIVWVCIQEVRGVLPNGSLSSESYQAGYAILLATVIGWWLAVVPRPYSYSVRATMGRPLTFSDCKMLTVVALGLAYVLFLQLLPLGDILRAASGGGVSTLRLSGLDPGRWLHFVVRGWRALGAPL